MRALVIAACIAAAAIAGALAGGLASPGRPQAPAALRALDPARVQARARLARASTRPEQVAAARGLAALYRRLPGQTNTARAYSALAAAETPPAYAAAAARVDAAEARVQAALQPPARRDPAVPPALPLVLLVSAAAGVFAATRLRRDEPNEPAPAPAHEPRARVAWDTPPPELG
jgi:hypothetical protein